MGVPASGVEFVEGRALPSPPGGSGCVWLLKIADCPNVYVGQTGRCLKQCLSEHCCALRNGDTQASALAEHVFTTGHAVDLSQSEVLDQNQHTTTRCMLESWHIQQSQTVLNRNPTRSLHGTPGLIDGHVTYIHWYFVSVQCIGFVCIGNSLTQLWCIEIIFYFFNYIHTFHHYHHTLFIQPECFALAIHWWRWLYSHQDVWNIL